MLKSYTASFTTGGLLFEEMERVIAFLSVKGVDRQIIAKSANVLTINSATARIRQARELLKRYDSVDSSFWDFYLNQPDKVARRFAVYYACLKTYPLVMDFHMEVVLPKWRQMKYKIGTEDVIKFLKWALIEHPEIDKWKESTLLKISRLLVLMLKESGLLVDGKLQPVRLADSFWIYFLEHGEGWFLEAMLLSKEQRESILNKV